MSVDLHLAKILIIDDELSNVRLLEDILRKQKYRDISMTTDPRRSVALFVESQPDLVLLDLKMPHLSGYEVMSALEAVQDSLQPVPIIVCTADATAEARHRAFVSGATDYISKPFDQAEVSIRVRNSLQTRFLRRRLENDKRILDQRVRERTETLQATLSQLREAQKQALQQERLSALGMMATGIAHDFNNLLSLIIGYGELLLNEQDAEAADPKMTRYLQTIISAAGDGANMVNRLAQFQRPRSESDLRQGIALERLVQQVVEMTMPRWKEQTRANGINIELKTELAADSNIVGDKSEFRELLTNMIFNAVDAMPKGGTLTLRARPEGELVCLEIEDTGIGMSEEVRQRCLEPFFTTKGERGSGLGLAMIYGIVQRAGGTLAIRSQVNRGTCFSIHLPKGDATSGSEGSIPEQVGESLQILVVDDQPILREILMEQLATDCHQVEAVGDADSAIARFHEKQFDLVITDKAMPGMSGEQLAAVLREIRDDVRIILLTGFAENGISESYSKAIDVVLGKPVNFTTLRQAIARAVIARDPQPDTFLLPVDSDLSPCQTSLIRGD